jgi:hypothetical protein
VAGISRDVRGNPRGLSSMCAFPNRLVTARARSPNTVTPALIRREIGQACRPTFPVWILSREAASFHEEDRRGALAACDGSRRFDPRAGDRLYSILVSFRATGTRTDGFLRWKISTRTRSSEAGRRALRLRRGGKLRTRNRGTVEEPISISVEVTEKPSKKTRSADPTGDAGAPRHGRPRSSIGSRVQQDQEPAIAEADRRRAAGDGYYAVASGSVFDDDARGRRSSTTRTGQEGLAGPSASAAARVCGAGDRARPGSPTWSTRPLSMTARRSGERQGRRSSRYRLA